MIGLTRFWSVISWVINTLIFFISGMFVADKLFSTSPHLGWTDFAWLLLLYVLLSIIRALTIAILYPFLKITGMHVESVHL